MKDFSIIVPAYNVEKYIEKCIDSILNQSYKNYEVIVINDGSTDDTLNILNKKYKDKVKIYSKENGGLSSARNYGVLKSSSKYILFVDSDDWLEPDLLLKLSEQINKNFDDLICYRLQKYYDKKNIFVVNELPLFNKLSGIDALSKLILSHKTFETAVIYAYKSEFYKRNKFSFCDSRYHEDFGLIPYVIARAKTVSSIYYVGYNYLQREGSITKNLEYSKVFKKSFDTLYQMGILNYEFLNMEIDSNIRNIIANYLMTTVIKKYYDLNKFDRKIYLRELRKIKAYKLFRCTNIKSIIKKVLVYINPKLYKIFVR